MDTDLPEVDYPHLPGEEHNPLMESSLHAQWVTMLVQSVHRTLADSGHLVTGSSEALNLTFGQVDGRLALCCPGGRAVRPGDDPFGWLVEERHRADRAELALAAYEEELELLRARVAELEAERGDAS